MNMLSFDRQSYLNVSSKQICSKRILGKRQRDCVGAPGSQKVESYDPKHLSLSKVASLRMQGKGLIQAASMEFRPEPHTQGGGWNVQLWVCIWCDGLPWWLSGKESTYQYKRHGFIPWVGRSPGEGNGNPLQYSCLENPMDRGVW